MKNRAEFYGALLPRIPHPELRARLQAAVGKPEPPPALAEAFAGLAPHLAATPFLRALALRDLLKKPGYGSALGRTTISVAEALGRAEFVEETGVTLFGTLAGLGGESELLRGQAEQHRQSLTELLALGDALRYHRFAL